jgi:predicted kinase
MPVLEMFVGFPGTGKSYLMRSLTLAKPAYVFCTDHILEIFARKNSISYDEAYDLYFKEADKSARKLLEYAIKHQWNVVFDQTNLSQKKRMRVLRRMSQAGYRCVGRYIEPPTDDSMIQEWNLRLNDRPGKTIDNTIIEYMRLHFTEPSIEDGFDELYVYDMMGNLLRKITK